MMMASGRQTPSSQVGGAGGGASCTSHLRLATGPLGMSSSQGVPHPGTAAIGAAAAVGGGETFFPPFGVYYALLPPTAQGSTPATPLRVDPSALVVNPLTTKGGSLLVANSTSSWTDGVAPLAATLVKGYSASVTLQRILFGGYSSVSSTLSPPRHGSEGSGTTGGSASVHTDSSSQHSKRSTTVSGSRFAGSSSTSPKQLQQEGGGLPRRATVRFVTAVAARLLRQLLVRCLGPLHEANSAHGRLGPQFVRISCNGSVQLDGIGDLRLFEVDSVSSLFPSCGSEGGGDPDNTSLLQEVVWSAPERQSLLSVANSRRRLSDVSYPIHEAQAADVFAFGLLVFALGSGARPYPTCRDASEVLPLSHLQERLDTRGCPLDAIAEDGLRQIATKCLRVDPAERPTVRDLIDFVNDTLQHWDHVVDQEANPPLEELGPPVPPTLSSSSAGGVAAVANRPSISTGLLDFARGSGERGSPSPLLHPHHPSQQQQQHHHARSSSSYDASATSNPATAPVTTAHPKRHLPQQQQESGAGGVVVPPAPQQQPPQRQSSQSSVGSVGTHAGGGGGGSSTSNVTLPAMLPPANSGGRSAIGLLAGLRVGAGKSGGGNNGQQLNASFSSRASVSNSSFEEHPPPRSTMSGGLPFTMASVIPPLQSDGRTSSPSQGLMHGGGEGGGVLSDQGGGGTTISRGKQRQMDMQELRRFVSALCFVPFEGLPSPHQTATAQVQQPTTTSSMMSTGRAAVRGDSRRGSVSNLFDSTSIAWLPNMSLGGGATAGGGGGSASGGGGGRSMTPPPAVIPLEPHHIHAAVVARLIDCHRPPPHRRPPLPLAFLDRVAASPVHPLPPLLPGATTTTAALQDELVSFAIPLEEVLHLPQQQLDGPSTMLSSSSTRKTHTAATAAGGGGTSASVAGGRSLSPSSTNNQPQQPLLMVLHGTHQAHRLSPFSGGGDNNVALGAAAPSSSPPATGTHTRRAPRDSVDASTDTASKRSNATSHASAQSTAQQKSKKHRSKGFFAKLAKSFSCCSV